MTVRTRLEEFEATPAAQLTMEQLRRSENEALPEMETEQDPPSFSRGRLPINPLRAPLLLTGQAAEEGALAVMEEAAPLPGRAKRKPSQSSLRRTREREALYSDVREQLAAEVEESIEEPDVKRPRDEGGSEDEEESDLDEDELSGFVLSAEEAAKKGAIWQEMNKEYLEDKAVKEKRQAEDMKLPDSKKKKKRSYSKAAVQNTAEEALEQTLVSKKISKKINYEALGAIFGAQGEVTSEYAGPSVTARRRAPPQAPQQQVPRRASVQEAAPTDEPVPSVVETEATPVADAAVEEVEETLTQGVEEEEEEEDVEEEEYHEDEYQDEVDW